MSIGNPRIAEATCTLQSTAVAPSNVVVPKSNIVVSCTAQSFGVVIASHTEIMTARMFGGCY